MRLKICARSKELQQTDFLCVLCSEIFGLLAFVCFVVEILKLILGYRLQSVNSSSETVLLPR